MNLEKKSVLLTGGVAGIGREIAQKLMERGACLAVVDINPSGLEQLAAELPGCVTYLCDISDPAQVDECVERWFEKQGHIDILINNAGILFNKPLVRFGPGGVEKHDAASWQKVIDVNLSGTFYMTSSVAAKMLQKRTRGLIVNISSISAAGNRGQSAYSAAKAGVNALTATWAKELGVMGIRVVGLAPGYSDTPSTHKVLSEDMLRQIKSEVPLRRLGRAEEIANGVMAVIENDFFNGKVLALDGGMVI